MATETKTDLPASAASKPADPERQTSSEIPIQPYYRPADVAAIPYEERVGDPGRFPYTRGLYPEMYRKRHWTMRQYAGYSSAAESNQRYRYLLSQGTTGLSVAFDLPTQIGYDSDRAHRPRRGGPRGRGHRLDRGHAAAVRRHPPGPGDDLDDDQCHGGHSPVALPGGGRGAGGFVGQGRRHGAERHPEGVRGPRHLHLSARAVAQAGDGHHRLLRRPGAEVEHDLDLGLPHARGRLDGRAGGGLHARQRSGLRAGGPRPRARHRRLRPAPVVLLQRPQQLPRRGGEVPGGPAAVGGAGPGALRSPGSPVSLDALPHADGGLDAHGPAADEQRGAGGDPGLGGGVRRHAVAPHELARRGARPSHGRRRHGWPSGPSR